ncbi:hypothetical protein EW026_g4690 [Hermanssonia centrifuga]|uniref:C2H2-type domain-containing protein n=1 Tax=Hermanssonia centrifuga TaxID=98765 RepID=A0A4V3XA95_9APHY|nr:hypothetical protein EW026_g4690 [Hermanssonia centrifuga]
MPKDRPLTFLPPSAATIQTAAAALQSLATLSLAGSPPPQAVPHTSTSFASAAGQMHLGGSGTSEGTSVKQEEEDFATSVSATARGELAAGGISIKLGNGKKRGTIFTCESCSKVYRHPSCLIKHRWEHSPHWREASKFLLSKHQQVQMLEAAAILSHLSPANSGGHSLPEDRSLWPSFLSGGLLPPPVANGVSNSGVSSTQDTSASSSETHTPLRVSSSVPAHLSIGITHVRPGVLGVPTGSSPASSVPVPVPVDMNAYRESNRYGSPISYSSAFGAQSYDTGGSWSLPRSSVRSRSTSAPKSEGDEGVEVEVDIEGDDLGDQRYGFISRGRMSAARDGMKDEDDGYMGNLREEKIEEEWDGEMEMEM